MMTLEQLKTELVHEQRLLGGYTNLLAIPKPLLSSDAQREVTEAQEWSTVRIARLSAMIEAWTKLLEHGWESGPHVETVSEDVFNELNESLKNVQLAVSQFKSPITVTSVVVEE